MYDMHIQYVLVSHGLAGQKRIIYKYIQIYKSLEGTAVPTKGIKSWLTLCDLAAYIKTPTSGEK
jgi:hypothetical protein